MTDRQQAYAVQHGGDHYRAMGMQPFQFSLRNKWDSAAHSILKYLSRYRSKAGLEDLRKGRHIVDIRQTEIESALPGIGLITMATYLDLNNITGPAAEALLALEGWVQGRLPWTTVARHIDDLIENYDACL